MPRGKRRGPWIPDVELLIAIDGRFGGKNLCQIAVDLYGEARVAIEWSSDSSMRARVRWRVKQAFKLMNGDYRDLIAGALGRHPRQHVPGMPVVKRRI